MHHRKPQPASTHSIRTFPILCAGSILRASEGAEPLPWLIINIIVQHGLAIWAHRVWPPTPLPCI